LIIVSFSIYFDHTLATPPSTPNMYTHSLHDALPICGRRRGRLGAVADQRAALGAGVRRRLVDPAAAARLALGARRPLRRQLPGQDRKSTRLNSSHVKISYAVFWLKKKKEQIALAHKQ